MILKYFVLCFHRKGGFGGLDIWFCIIDKYGNFGILMLVQE